MSIKQLAEGIENARANKRELRNVFEGKMNNLIRIKHEEIRELEEMKAKICAEFDEQERDYDMLMDGAA